MCIAFLNSAKKSKIPPRTFRKVTCEYLWLKSSKIGAIALQGPHQEAGRQSKHFLSVFAEPVIARKFT